MMDPFLVYLIAVNVVAFLLFTIDYLIMAGNDYDWDTGLMDGRILSLFAVAGGAPGMLLALAVWARRVNKRNIAWWFTAIVCLVVWGMVCAWNGASSRSTVFGMPFSMDSTAVSCMDWASTCWWRTWPRSWRSASTSSSRPTMASTRGGKAGCACRSCGSWGFRCWADRWAAWSRCDCSATRQGMVFRGGTAVVRRPADGPVPLPACRGIVLTVARRSADCD